MTFEKYIDHIEKTPDQIRTELACHPQTIWHYRTGKRTPSKEMMERIYVWSGGLVTPNDFHTLPIISGNRLSEAENQQDAQV